MKIKNPNVLISPGMRLKSLPASCLMMMLVMAICLNGIPNFKLILTSSTKSDIFCCSGTSEASDVDPCNCCCCSGKVQIPAGNLHFQCDCNTGNQASKVTLKNPLHFTDKISTKGFLGSAKRKYALNRLEMMERLEDRRIGKPPQNA